MADYGRTYDRPAEPGWIGGGFYPGAGYRREGYHVQGRSPRESRYNALVFRPGRSYDRGYGREFRPFPRRFPPYSPQARGPVPSGYAADYFGGGFGPSYYTGGLSGRELGRGQRP